MIGYISGLARAGSVPTGSVAFETLILQ